MVKKIIVAKNIGFCSGVKRAVETTEKLLKELGNLYTIGDIVHNSTVMDNLKLKGLKVCSSLKEVKGKYFLIRSHGLPKGIIRQLENKNIKIFDMTCPFVKKIHQKVEKLEKEGFKVFVIGDKKHPEVKGIRGYGKNIKIIESIKDLKKFKNEKVAVLSQSTINFSKYLKIVKHLINNFKAKEIWVFNTICKVTEKREKECIELGKKVELILILGSKKSSNTKKLFQISKKFCRKTYLVEKILDLSKINIKNINSIGIISGTSTPDFLIDEILKYLKKLGFKEVK